jgi:predicted nucleic acid-binding protein
LAGAHKIVADASVVIKWLNPLEALADKAELLRDHYAQGHFSLIVPAFFDYEIANAINKTVARGDLSESEGVTAVALVLALQAERMPWPAPHESYDLARRYKRSVYDSLYLHLAEQTSSEFWTADLKLYNGAKNQVAQIRWLGDYQ